MGLVYKLGHRTAKKMGESSDSLQLKHHREKTIYTLQPTNIGKRSDSARVMFPVDKTKSF